MLLERPLRLAPLRLRAAQHLDEARVTAERVDPGVADEERVAEKSAVDGEGDAADRLLRRADAGERAAHVVLPLGVGEVVELAERLHRALGVAFDRRVERVEDAERERGVAAAERDQAA